MNVCHLYTEYLQWPEKGIHSLELELQVVIGHEHGCWKPNSSLLEEQQAPLTAEPSLQTLVFSLHFQMH